MFQKMKTLKAKTDMFCSNVMKVSQKEALVVKNAFVISCLASMFLCMATGGGDGTDNTLNDLMGNIIGLITTLFKYIGILLLCWAIGQLVMAFKNEDADSKSRAMMLLIVSIILISLEGIIGGVLENSNIGIDISDPFSSSGGGSGGGGNS